MNINVEAKVLLDKLYNLRSIDSVILTKMDDEKKVAEETKKRTLKEKEDLTQKIRQLNNEEALLAKEGTLLKDALKNVNKPGYVTVFNKLEIDFSPKELCEKVEKLLPTTLKSIKTEVQTSNDELNTVVKEMNDSITTIDELGIRKDEAINHQTKLNEYIDLSLNGNINITRDAITNLLAKFNLSSEEQRECAKILMFPEDALYEYNENSSKKDSKSLSDVFAEAKTIEQEESKSVKFEDLIVKNETKEEVKVEEKVTKVESNFEKEPQKTAFLEKVEVKTEVKQHASVSNALVENGFQLVDFSKNDIAFLEKNFVSDVFNANLKLVSELGINKDILSENIELLIDSELNEKFKILLNIGKVPFDIYLNPNILLKYNIEELNESIASLKESGLDPKKVPLMAY